MQMTQDIIIISIKYVVYNGSELNLSYIFDS